MKVIVLIFSCFNAACSFATQYEPWVGNLFEFESRSSLLYQHYPTVDSRGHSFRRSADDLFLDASLANALLPNTSLELELIAASTCYQKGDIDSLSLTGRYVWLDDVVGDVISLATGMHLIQAFHHSVKDISSFHHSKAEGEIFVSLGKEISCESTWTSRWWAMGALGLSDSGSPWVRGNFVYEKQWLEQHLVRGFCHLLWGFGSKRLNLFHFNGYGTIAHESVDIGIRYSYDIPFFGSLSLEYAYRPYARNFPSHTSLVLAQMYCTFGL